MHTPKHTSFHSIASWLRRSFLGSLLALALLLPTAGALAAPTQPATQRPVLDAPVAAPNAIRTVTSLVDPGTGGCTVAECTLREAVAVAVAGDTIVFAPALANGTITLNGSEIGLNKNLIIDGAAAPGLKIDGNNASRVFNINTASVNVSILNLTVQRGRAPGTNPGGAILNGGTVLISNTLVLSSTAQNGGGLRNQQINTNSPLGVMTLVNSTVRGNSAVNNGGGISTNTSTTIILNTAIISNTALGTSTTSGLGGGVHHVNANVTPVAIARTTTITNTTIAGNIGNGGAGIYVDNRGRVDVYNSTIAANAATNTATAQVGGIFLGVTSTGQPGDLLRLKNTIVADNVANNTTQRGADVGNSTGLSITSSGYNLLENVVGATIGGTTTGNIVGQDPRLGPLRNNGGPTLTKALLVSSPAINGGDPAFVPPPTTDQRGPGFPRVLLGRVDIGAYETVDLPQLTSPFVVNSTNEPGTGGCTSAECTLREAITLANTTPTTDTINFNIFGSTVQTITPTSALPFITTPMIIDASTQPGASCPATPRIQLVGNSAGAGTSGLEIIASGVTVRGLIINRFGGVGIRINGGANALIQCNFIGTDATGTTALGNNTGVTIINATNAVIGGTTAAARNTLSGNTTYGILILANSSNALVQGNYIGTNALGTAALGNTVGVMLDGATTATIGGTVAGARNVISGNTQGGIIIMGAGATGNLVQGNYIGTNALGTATLGNTGSGVSVSNVASNTIGGTIAGAGNVISGNRGDGVTVTGTNSTGTLVAGNLIGTNAAGTASISNTFNGVVLNGSVNVTIGGTTTASRNIISGNGQNGVNIVASGTGGTGNVVQGNYIGTNAPGTAALGNTQNGVRLSGVASTTIGGSTANAGNVIAGNTLNGVRLENVNTSANIITANRIGTNAAGLAALPNSQNGIALFAGVSNTTIGGTVAGVRNIISANAVDGISINGSATTTLVQGNYIGTNLSGTGALGNTNSGIAIGFSANNTIGGTAAGAGNVISGNSTGIFMSALSTTGNVVQGNRIGTIADGTAALGNASNGIVLSGVANNTIGGTVAGARNIISGNGQNGINMFTAGTTGNIIQGNYIGTNINGTVDLGNNQNGIRMFRVSNNTVGGTAAGAGNLISGNNQNGILVSEVEAVGNRIQGNVIGTRAGGTIALPNSVDGVRIDLNNPTNTIIGGQAPSAGNIIAFNTGRGVNVVSGTGHRISGNNIFSNGSLGIDLGNDGLTANDAGDPDTGPNNRQNFPTLAQASTGTSTSVAGTLNSAANTTYTLEFFSNTACETSGFGEGAVFRGFTTATTNATGNASFSAVLANSVPVGQFVTATATDPNGNTSEFGQCVTVASQPSLVINNRTVVEGNAGTVNAVFTVSLSTASAQAVTVEYATANGTATAPADYTAIPTTTLTFAPLQTTRTITVIVASDLLDELDETFFVNLANSVNASIADNQGLGTITDDDGAPSISITDASVLEGNAGTTTLQFTVALGAASAKTITLNYATANGTATAPADYTATSGILSFAPGQISQTVAVTVVGDLFDEADETLLVNLSNAVNASIADPQATGTILDDDLPPALTISDVTVVEGNAGTVNAVFTVSTGSASLQQITVDYATANGTATAPADYSATSGTLSFAPLQTTRTITVAVVGDLLDELDETFFINLSNASNATLADAQGVGTITDDDAPPALRIGDVTVIEGDAGTGSAVFTVTLDAPSGLAVTVDYSTADGTATAPADYAASSGTLTFAPGQTSQTITVAVVGDLLNERDETFTVNLSNASNATLADAQGVGTITDNDETLPSISLSDVALREQNSGSTTFVFTATLDTPSGQTVTLDYGTADGTATAPSDYTAIPTATLSFAPGQITQLITVTVNGDTAGEPDETFFVNLANPVNAVLADAQAVGTIINDDGSRIFLPLILKGGEPDLVVESVTPSANNVTVVIKNQGSAPVSGAFYVDVYINPATAPTMVNQTWELVGSEGGLVWGVQGSALPINPGETRTLTINDAYYLPGFSSWSGSLAAGSTLYAQVDSANAATTYGAVLEADERPGQTYNNIFGPITTTLLVQTDANAKAAPPSTTQLPARPSK